jgi:hypothetical protein
MGKENKLPIADSLMSFYDMATDISGRESISHREAFRPIATWLALNKQIKEQEAETGELQRESRPLNGELVILRALTERKAGEG